MSGLAIETDASQPELHASTEAENTPKAEETTPERSVSLIRADEPGADLTPGTEGDDSAWVCGGNGNYREDPLWTPSWNEGETEKSPLFVSAPKAPPPPTYFDVQYQGEGKVTKVLESEFEAIVHDLKSSDFEEEFVVFELKDVPASEHAMILPGAIFYWTVGEERRLESLQVKRRSRIRFRRLPIWSKRDKSVVEREAKLLGDSLGLHQRPSASNSTDS